jgi:acyl-coenzyme A synthetase/AMP-(fatty) acid ligase/acyl-CoA reductase-like NAD-dependent aldehyde dehydrogenase
VLVEDDRRRSWDEVLTETARIGAALRRRGVSESDRVLVSAVNSDVSVLTILALLDLGVSLGLVDRGVAPERCAALVADSGARWFVSDHDHLDTPFDRVGVGWIPLTELASADVVAEQAELTFDRWRERQDGLVVWTSGSLGRPKGVVRTGGSVLRNVARTQDRMGYTPDDVLLPLLPFTHQYGLSILLLWWQARATLTLVPSRRIDLALDTIAQHGVTVVDAVPAGYEGMLRMIAAGRVDAGSLAGVRMWCVGGEPLQDDLRQRFAHRMGAPLLDGYGSSEAGNIALATVDHPLHCGRPLDGITVTVLDDQGVAVPPGQTGEVVVTSPDIMAGTLEPGGKVRPVHRPAYHTQDLGFLDEHGNLRVVGRKAAVHRFGNTLYPDAIAAQLASCGAPVRVLPVENGRLGTELVFAVADPAQRPAAHWRRVFAGLVSEAEQPNKVLVLPEFPQHGNGKTDLVSLGGLAAAAIGPRRGTSDIPTRASASIGQATDLSPVAFADRITALQDLVGLLTERRAEVLRILTEVSNHRTASDEIDSAIEALEGAVAEVIRYGPPAVDRISVLMPSNIPLYGYILYLVIPTLYSRSVVFRPSRSIAAQTTKLHELLSAEHGLPIVLDSSGQREFMATHGPRSDVLVFTGTYDNAEQVRAELPRTTLFLFFGQGVNPFIVGADADLDAAVDGLIQVRMLNSGQDCFGPDVVFVDAAVSARFLNLLCRRVEALRYGRLDDAGADYGPMFYQEAFESTLDYLRTRRELLAAGSQIDFMSAHLRPTVLIHPTDTTFLPPELFAPVFNVVPFTNTEWLHGMLTHAYYAERAMAATVYGTMPDTVEKLRKRHTVSVDETLMAIESGNRPFGGKGIRANYAALGRKRHAEPLLLSKAIADHLSQPVTEHLRKAS